MGVLAMVEEFSGVSIGHLRLKFMHGWTKLIYCSAFFNRKSFDVKCGGAHTNIKDICWASGDDLSNEGTPKPVVESAGVLYTRPIIRRHTYEHLPADV